MSIYETTPSASGGGGDFEQVSAGTHPAVLVALIDHGSHEETFQGKALGLRRKVYLVWEVLDENKLGSNQHQTIGREFTLSLHEKAGLNVLLGKWRNRPIAKDEKVDVRKAVGVKCLLSVSHKPSASGDKVYAQVDGCASVPAGMSVGEATYPKIIYEIGPGEPPAADWIPWIMGKPSPNKVKLSPEWQAANGQQAAAPAKQQPAPANGQSKPSAPMPPPMMAAPSLESEIPF